MPPGTLLATVQGFDGSVVSLESPCDCLVLEQIGLNGQHYQVGDPLIALVEADRPLMIRAQLPLDEVEGLEVGDRAEISFPGRDELLYGQIERIDLRPRLEALRNPESRDRRSRAAWRRSWFARTGRSSSMISARWSRYASLSTARSRSGRWTRFRGEASLGSQRRPFRGIARPCSCP